MLNKKQVKKLIILDTLIVTCSLLVFGFNAYFANVIHNIEVKEVFTAISIFGVLASFLSLRTLIKDIKLLPKKVVKTTTVTNGQIA